MKQLAYLPLTALLALVMISLHTQAAFAQDDATVADPAHYTVAFENDQVRVVRIKYEAHGKSEMHTHPAALVICLDEGKTRMTYPDGKTEETECTPTEPIWAPAVTHLPENLRDSPMEVFLVEVKPPTMPGDRIAQILECKLKEGKTIEEAHAANSKWVVFINDNVEGGDIRSYVMTPQVGNIETGSFMYIDSYPSLESWAAGDKAIAMTAGKAIMDELQAVAECSKNSLHKSKQS